jgi:hypothetical protein
VFVAEKAEVRDKGFEVRWKDLGEVGTAREAEVPRIGDAGDGNQVMGEEEAEMRHEKCPGREKGFTAGAVRVLMS